jgi:hypothetical protein
MILGKKIVVVLPAYNAEKTLARTVAEIPADAADTVILVDDASSVVDQLPPQRGLRYWCDLDLGSGTGPAAGHLPAGALP